MTDPNRAKGMLARFFEKPAQMAHMPGQPPHDRPIVRAAKSLVKADPGQAGVLTLVAVYTVSCAAAIAVLGSAGSMVGAVGGLGLGFAAGRSVMRWGQKMNRDDREGPKSGPRP